MASRRKPDVAGAMKYLESLRVGLPKKVSKADIKVAELLSAELRKRVPVLTGKLKASIRVVGSSAATKELGKGKEIKIGFKHVPYGFPVNARTLFIDKSIAAVVPKAAKIYDDNIMGRGI